MKTTAAAIGIDLGSSRSVIAGAIRGGVEIFANEGSFRETPNIVGYGDAQRYLGNEGLTKKKSNFKSTIEFFMRFLGMNKDSSDYASEKKFVYCPTAANADGRIVFKPRYQGEQIEVLPEQVLASMLTKLKMILELNNIDQKDIVLSVPSYYTQMERKLVLMAGKIAGLNIVKLMNESAAVVLNYGIFRKKDLSDDARLVAFVDIGHSKTSILFAKVKKNGAEIVLEKTDRCLGGRDFDQILFKHYQQIFDNKENIDLYEYPKSKMRLIDAIEKQRKMLSANAEAPLNVEFLVEDIDFHQMMTRDEFEKLCAPLIDRFKNLMLEAFKEAGFSTKEFHSVEVVGGMTRTPAMQEIIKSTFNVEDISRTLNQSESVARGCAIQAAIKSPLFQVAEYNITEKNLHPVLCKYVVQKQNDEGNFEEKEYNNTLFKFNCDFPTIMTISVSKATQAKLQLFYQNENPVHSDRLLLDVETKPAKPKEADYKILLKGRIDDNGIIGLRCAELEETYMEEVKIPKKKEEKKKDDKKKDDKKEDKKDDKPAEGEKKDEAEAKDDKMDEEEFEVQMKKRTRITDLKYTDKMGKAAFSDAVCEALLAVEGRMCMKDKLVRDTLATKNDLESFIYDSRAKIQEDYKVHATDKETQDVLAITQETETWLYDIGQNVSRDEYLIKHENITKIIGPVKKRMEDYHMLKDMLNYAHNKFNHYRGEIPNNAEKYGHLTPDDQAEIERQVEGGTRMFIDAQKKLSHADLKQNPPVSFDTLKATVLDIEKACDKILSKPKPAPPPKEEKKAEEKPAEGAEDKKMDEEEIPGNQTPEQTPEAGQTDQRMQEE